MNLASLSRALIAALALASAPRAEFPLEGMTPHRLGIQYGLAFRGQDITARDIHSHEVIHTFSLGYAPLPYLAFEAGLGLDRFSVDRYNGARFEGGYGLSPLFGLTLASPPLFGLLRFTGGGRALYLNSEDERGYAYSGLIASPFLSALVTPTAYFDIAAGVRGHAIYGSMQGPGGTARDFSNRENVRGFFSFTVKSPAELAFLTLDADFSPAAGADWSGGPHEASIGVSFGTLLGWKAESAEPKTSPPYFPAYPEMKEKQKKMAEELE